MKNQQQVVAIVPAAGNATRLFPLPFSKELYPSGLFVDDSGVSQPKVVSHYLMDKFKSAGIKKVLFSIRKGKADIMEHFGDGLSFGVDASYLITTIPFGAPYTVDRAYNYIKEDIVALGFPDILFEPEDAHTSLLDQQIKCQADVVLGLFPADRPDKCDLVETDQDGLVKKIVIKSAQSHLAETWGIAVWTPVFTKYLHDFLAVRGKQSATDKELHIGDVIQSAINDGLYVDAIRVSEKPFIDIGTPDDLEKAIHEYSARE